MRRSSLWLALVLAAILGAMAAKSLLVSAPPVRTSPADGQFDANRAKARLGLLLREERPHPTDTEANDVVRSRLVALLTGMGLQPVVRDQLACNELYKTRGVSCARVRNVIAVLGPAEGKALLLSAHYDSSPVGPGAGDAGAGVATLLEVGAILKGRGLPRPVILLFNEGEELGLIGARAFLADPLSRNVDSLINLEARGARGPVNMFETSRPNGPAIAVFKRAVENPVANSLSTDVYRLMPNYTDVNTFSEREWLTLNFGFIGNETRYHSPGDNLAALDAATLQHMGDQTLAIARDLSAGTPSGSDERIFMDLTGRALLTLPLWLGVVSLVVLVLAFAWLVHSRGGALRSGALVLGSVALSAGLSWGAVALIEAVRHPMFWRAHPMWTHLAAYATAMLITVVLIETVGRRADRRQHRAFFWLTFLLVGSAIAIMAPGGIIFFLFPPLAMLAGIISRRWFARAEQAGAVAAIVILYLTWGAMLGLLEELLNSGPMWLFAPLGALLIIPTLVEAKPLIDAARWRASASLAAVLALLGWAAASAAPAYSADRQQRFSIEHVSDARTGKALWSVLNGGAPLPDAYEAVGDWRWAEVPYAKAKRWVAPTSAAPGMRPPAVERLAELRNGNERLVTVRLRPNGSTRITLIGPKDAQVRAAGVRGFVRPVDPTVDAGDYLVSCFGRSCDGLELQIVIAKPEPVEFKLVGSRSGLPPSARPLTDARPRFARPQYAPDQTIVFARVKL